jgi:signal transduction histidine kinase/CheY-like chemotaxis protein
MSTSPHDPAALRDELVRQSDLLRRERPVRLVAMTLANVIAATLLPPSLILPCLLAVILGEIGQFLLDREPARLVEPARYRLYLLMAFLLETGFVMPPAILWHLDDPFMKAFAVGLATCLMLHVAKVRSIHLPMGLTGIAAVALPGLASNTLYWLPRGELTGFLVSTLCALVAIGYALGAIVVSNRLHRESAERGLAAQSANAAKDRFLAQMSHELRTPLNAILGMGHAELRRARDPASRDHLSVLITAAQGLSVILDDILDMSAVQKGLLPIRPVPVSPRDEILATAELFRPIIEEAGVALLLDLAPDLPARSRLDPQRLRQCLSNLLSNALKHTTSGSIRITARTEPRVGARPLLRIEVSDTGPGIDAGRQEAIFDPVLRDPDATAPAGNGLGLSISRALARRMGGDLWALGLPRGESGAHFVLTLEQEILADPPAPPPARQPQRPEETELAGRRVLVVDDIATNRLVAKAYLQLFGIIAAEAGSGPEALAMVRGGGFDLMLLDMNMPGMDGVATFHALRALPGPEARLPVVAMTADAMEDQRSAYLAEGIDGYVAKPVTPERIAAELRRVLAG